MSTNLPLNVDELHGVMHSVRQLVQELLHDSDENSLPVPVDINHVAQLNQVFCAWISEVNRRLRLCEVQLRAHNKLEAIRLAEMPPMLLDLYVELSSLDGDERKFWDELVIANDLPRPEALLANVADDLSSAYGDAGSGIQPLLDQLHILVLARAPLAARLNILWMMARIGIQYQQDLPVWEHSRLEQIYEEANSASQLPDPVAASKQLRSLLQELQSPEWTSAPERRASLQQSVERRLAMVGKRAAESQRQRQADDLKSLGRQIIEAVRIGDVARVRTLSAQWSAQCAQSGAAADDETVRNVESTLARFAEDEARREHEAAARGGRVGNPASPADWYQALEEFREALATGITPIVKLSGMRQRAVAIGSSLQQPFPAELEAAYQARLAAIPPSAPPAPAKPRKSPRTVLVLVVAALAAAGIAAYFLCIGLLLMSAFGVPSEGMPAGFTCRMGADVSV
jgi:hypothetical protein